MVLQYGGAFARSGHSSVGHPTHCPNHPPLRTGPSLRHRPPETRPGSRPGENQRRVCSL